MEEVIRITAPVVDNYRWNGHRPGDRLSILTDEAKVELARLVESLKQIKPTVIDGEQSRWDFWVDVPKGELEDYGDYKELKAEKVYKNKKEFIEDWKRDYPKDIYWHEITIVTEAKFTGLWLDDNCLIEQDLDEEKENMWPNTSYIEFLQFLTCKVNDIIDGIRKGTYNDYLKSALPYDYRTGVIKRKCLWELDSKRKNYDIGDLTELEISEFLVYISNNTDETEADNYFPQMSAGKYYEICSWCYTAAKYKDIQGLSPKEMFLKKGDRRDGGLSTLDENDEDAFDAWYNLSWDDKWEIENPSHMWEIRAGHTHTMIHLFLNKDKNNNGYIFSLSGGDHCQSDVVVRMFNTLKQHNIPVSLYEADKIAKKITGADDVGMIPVTETAWTYWYGGFKDKNVINFDTLRECDNVEEIIKKTRWFDIPVLSLVEENNIA